MKNKINKETWERNEVYHFFSEFLNPMMTVGTEIDCTSLFQYVKEKGESFFLYYAYALLKASNEIEAYRVRIEEGEPVLYDRIDLLTPIMKPGSSIYHSVLLPYFSDFRKFYSKAKEIIDTLPENTDPHGVESKLKEEDNQGVLLVSALPGMNVTSYASAQGSREQPFPIILVTKMIQRDGHCWLPLYINVHHGLIDGKLLTDFTNHLQEQFDQF